MRGWVTVALASVVAAVTLASIATGSIARTSETKPVPGTAQTHNGVLLDTLFKKGEKYTLKVSGNVVVDPYNPRSWDAVYCFKSTNGTPCQPTPYAVCGLQLTWYRGTTYSHWTVFGCPGGGVAPLPYSPSHVYEQTIVPAFDARLKVGIGDSVPQDNTGEFQVTVTGPAATGGTSGASVAKLQRALKALGLYTGPLDGKTGARLTAAIKSFQRTVGLPPDGNCLAQCQQALTLAAALDDPALPPGKPPAATRTVAELQRDLAKLGFYTGPIDGRNSGLTTQAVIAFQRSVPLPADGKCSARCQSALVRALLKKT